MYQFIGEQEQWLLQIEEHLDKFHNSSMEAMDQLADLETCCCCCWDVLIDSPLSSTNTPHMLPSINAVGGREEMVPTVESSTTIVENPDPCQ